MVGKEVRQARQAARLTQAELAIRMGVDRSYVSGIERGQRNPTVLTMWHTAKALGLSLNIAFKK